MAHNIKMVVTDLDGTLFDNNTKVSNTDLNTLKELGEKGIIRVAATGRSLYSAKQALSNNFPIDYLVFSTGSGIMDWSDKKMLYEYRLPGKDVEYISNKLIERKINFSIHPPIPDTHCFLYYLSGTDGSDIIELIKLYKDYVSEINLKEIKYTDATQIRAVLPYDVDNFEQVSKLFGHLKVIRATSPINPAYIWLEVFSAGVSKGNGLSFLCRNLNISNKSIVCIGNDYNDIDMLNFAKHSYWVANAANELTTMKNTNVLSATNLQSGFTEAVGQHITLQ